MAKPGQIRSIYQLPDGKPILIVTEYDRITTTLLLPEEDYVPSL